MHSLSEVIPWPLPFFLEYLRALQRLRFDVGGWRLLHWPLRVLKSHLGVDTSPGYAQHLTACLCSPWFLGLSPYCRSRTSIPLPCSHPSRYCSFGGHCTWLTVSGQLRRAFRCIGECTDVWGHTGVGVIQTPPQIYRQPDIPPTCLPAMPGYYISYKI